MGGIRDRLLRRGNRRPSTSRVTTRVSVPISGIHRVVHITRRPISLRAPVNRRRSDRLNSFVPSGSTPTPTSTTSRAVLHRRLSSILSALAPHRTGILGLHFNLRSNEDEALRRINGRFGMAHRHVHRVRTGTLHGLHRPSEDEGLGSCLSCWSSFVVAFSRYNTVLSRVTSSVPCRLCESLGKKVSLLPRLGIRPGTLGGSLFVLNRCVHGSLNGTVIFCCNSVGEMCNSLSGRTCQGGLIRVLRRRIHRRGRCLTNYSSLKVFSEGRVSSCLEGREGWSGRVLEKRLFWARDYPPLLSCLCGLPQVGCVQV